MKNHKLDQQPASLPARLGRRGRVWTAAGALLLLYTLAALLHVHTQLQAVELGYRVSQEMGRRRQLQAEWRRMSLEAATLRHPRRLRAIATGQLGMVEPGAAQVVRQPEGRPGAGKGRQ